MLLNLTIKKYSYISKQNTVLIVLFQLLKINNKNIIKKIKKKN